MRRDLIVKTKSLVGTSDLTLLAPIKPGLVPALDAVSYKTRVKRLLRMLTLARTSSHEFALLRPFSDAVERVGRIHSVRVAIIEPEDEPQGKVLLAATFDGTWEAYFRVLWQKVGALLDVIFCNTVDYVSAVDNTFESWLEWARHVQVETDFFYSTPGLTVAYHAYLQRQELLQRIDDKNLIPLRRSDMSGRELVADQRRAQATPGAMDRRVLGLRHRQQSVELIAQGNAMGKSREATGEAMRQGLQALAVIYRLTDMFVPDRGDGRFLQRAARELLLEFIEMIKLLPDEIKKARERFGRQLDWLDIEDRPRPLPALPTTTPQFDTNDVQAGIVRPYEGMTHGCLLLMEFSSAAAGKAFARAMSERVTSDAKAKSGQLTVNIAFTHEGLRALGLTEQQLECFPSEFREGMAARASVLGDLRINHPRRWKLPSCNWPTAAIDADCIDLSIVHAVIQLRKGGGADSVTEVTDPANPLHEVVAEYASLVDGARLLSVQSMVAYEREHFGFKDGGSQPSIDPPTHPPRDLQYINQIQLGEILCGYDNAVDNAVDPAKLQPGLATERHDWLHNSSFLAVRKLKQDVAALETAVSKVTDTTTLGREEVLSKMMGRDLDGKALIAARCDKNDFNYSDDSHGRTCPLHAHIRRANPRTQPGIKEPPGARPPRITRRGLSYGPRYDFSEPPESEINAKERGLVFMAYGSSIAEQFEVVQSWLTGGNPTHGYSGHSDPFVGVAPNAQPRFFAFEHEAQAVSMQLDGTWKALEPYRPIVRLEWGLYLFTPSLKALRKLAQLPVARCPMRDLPWSAARGEAHIRKLQALKSDEDAVTAWKRVLEDAEARERFVSASVWAAIRDNHDGVLRTPYGVLVANRDLAMKVFEDSEQRYSVEGYRSRMQESMGEIYLGLDDSGPGGAYSRQSHLTNVAIKSIRRRDAFTLAQLHTAEVLQQFVKGARGVPNPADVTRWELTIDVREITDKVLERLCQEWFGLPAQAGEVSPGSARWDWEEGQPPLYPGNFTAPSRYIFQPRPEPLVNHYGMLYGRTLTDAFVKFVKPHIDQRTVPQALSGGDACIAHAILDAFWKKDLSSPEQVARTFVGALMGFLPTVDGNLRQSLHEWLGDGTFWSLRSQWAARPFNDDVAADQAFGDALRQAMQLRPVPELVWRTARSDHELGTDQNKVKILPGDTIVIAIVSATQQNLEHCRKDVMPIFGGDASATPAPTHACPGYAAAMGTMLGVFAALITAPFSMRPSPTPLALVLDGPMS